MIPKDKQPSFGTSYWALDVPGLTHDQAIRLASLVADSQVGLPASLVDPSQFLTLHLDRESVQVLRAALGAINTNEVGIGLMEIIDDWLLDSHNKA